ncbi:MAG: VOC family protein [Candidatus Rokuibacteriota bacterium]
MGLRHLALLTRDLPGTERFYTRVLGLEEAFEHAGMIFLRTPGSSDLLNFVETRRAFDPKASGLDHFGLHLTPARWKRVRERLKREGVRITGRRGRSAVYIEDPNGYTIELYVD